MTHKIYLKADFPTALTYKIVNIPVFFDLSLSSCYVLNFMYFMSFYGSEYARKAFVIALKIYTPLYIQILLKFQNLYKLNQSNAMEMKLPNTRICYSNIIYYTQNILCLNLINNFIFVCISCNDECCFRISPHHCVQRKIMIFINPIVNTTF